MVFLPHRLAHPLQFRFGMLGGKWGRALLLLAVVSTAGGVAENLERFRGKVRLGMEIELTAPIFARLIDSFDLSPLQGPFKRGELSLKKEWLDGYLTDERQLASLPAELRAELTRGLSLEKPSILLSDGASGPSTIVLPKSQVGAGAPAPAPGANGILGPDGTPIARGVVVSPQTLEPGNDRAGVALSAAETHTRQGILFQPVNSSVSSDWAKLQERWRALDPAVKRKNIKVEFLPSLARAELGIKYGGTYPLQLKASAPPAVKAALENLTWQPDPMGNMEFKHRKDRVFSDPVSYLRDVKRFAQLVGAWDYLLHPHGDPHGLVSYHAHASRLDGGDVAEVVHALQAETGATVGQDPQLRDSLFGGGMMSYQTTLRTRGTFRMYEPNHFERRVPFLDPEKQLEHDLSVLFDESGQELAGLHGRTQERLTPELVRDLFQRRPEALLDMVVRSSAGSPPHRTKWTLSSQEIIDGMKKTVARALEKDAYGMRFWLEQLQEAGDPQSQFLARELAKIVQEQLPRQFEAPQMGANDLVNLIAVSERLVSPNDRKLSLSDPGLEALLTKRIPGTSLPLVRQSLVIPWAKRLDDPACRAKLADAIRSGDETVVEKALAYGKDQLFSHPELTGALSSLLTPNGKPELLVRLLGVFGSHPGAYPKVSARVSQLRTSKYPEVAKAAEETFASLVPHDSRARRKVIDDFYASVPDLERLEEATRLARTSPELRAGLLEKRRRKQILDGLRTGNLVDRQRALLIIGQLGENGERPSPEVRNWVARVQQHLPPEFFLRELESGQTTTALPALHALTRVLGPQAALAFDAPAVQAALRKGIEGWGEDVDNDIGWLARESGQSPQVAALFRSLLRRPPSEAFLVQSLGLEPPPDDVAKLSRRSIFDPRPSVRRAALSALTHVKKLTPAEERRVLTLLHGPDAETSARAIEVVAAQARQGNSRLLIGEIRNEKVSSRQALAYIRTLPFGHAALRAMANVLVHRLEGEAPAEAYSVALSALSELHEKGIPVPSLLRERLGKKGLSERARARLWLGLTRVTDSGSWFLDLAEHERPLSPVLATLTEEWKSFDLKLYSGIARAWLEPEQPENLSTIAQELRWGGDSSLAIVRSLRPKSPEVLDALLHAINARMYRSSWTLEALAKLLAESPNEPEYVDVLRRWSREGSPQLKEELQYVVNSMPPGLVRTHLADFLVTPAAQCPGLAELDAIPRKP